MAKGIENKKLYKNSGALFVLLGQNYKLLQRFDPTHDVIVLNWIGKHPYNFHVDQLGIKPGSHFTISPESSSVDSKGIYSKVGYASSHLIAEESYQLCKPVASGPMGGHVCINEGLSDFFPDHKDDLIKIEFVKKTKDDIFNPTSYSVLSLEIESASKILPDSLKIKSAINHDRLMSQFITIALSQSLKIIVCMCASCCVLFFFQRKEYERYSKMHNQLTTESKKARHQAMIENKKIYSQFMTQHNCHLSLHKFCRNSENAAIHTIDTGREQVQFLLFLLENRHLLPADIKRKISEIDKTLSDAHNGLAKDFTVDEIKNAISDIPCIFGKTIIDNEIKLQCRVVSELHVVHFDIFTLQRIVGSLIVESLRSAKIDGTISLHISFFRKDSGVYAKIELCDDCLGKRMYRLDSIEHASMFPSMQDIKSLVESNGSIFQEDTAYKSTKISITLLLHRIQVHDNVVTLFKNNQSAAVASE